MSTGSNDKPLILLVDDSRVMRIALKKILQSDYEIVEASNGESGWEALQENPGVRCVFTDLSMPELDGFGLLERIRSSGDAGIKSVPVIIITGNEDDPSMKQRVIEKGANDVVMKPFQTNDILSTTQKHLAAAASKPAPAKKAAAPSKPAAPARPAAPAGGGDAAVAKLKSDLSSAVQRLRDMEGKLKEAQGVREQLTTELRDTQAAMQRQLDAEKSRREKAEAELKDAQSRIQSESDMEADVLEFQKQVDAALGRARRADEARKSVEDELARVRQEMMFRQQGGDRLKQDEEVNRLQRELDAAKKRADVAERVQSDYEEELSRLKAQLQESAGGGEELQTEIVARQKAESRVTRLEDELSAANRRATGAESELDSLKTRIAGLESELSRQSSAADGARGEAEELLRLEEEAHRQSEEQVQRLRRELELARKNNTDNEGAKHAAEQKKSQLEHKVNQLEAELKILREEGDTTKQVGKQVENLKTEIDALIVRAEAAELAQREAENEIANMAVELEAAEQAKRNAEHSVMRMTAQVNSMRKQVSQAEAMRTAAEQQLKDTEGKPAPRPRREESRPAEPVRETASPKPKSAPAEINPARDELVEINKPRSAPRKKLQDRFNDTMVAIWSKQQRGRRRMRFVVGALVIAVAVGAAWYKGWWPFDAADEATRDVRQAPAAEAAPAPTATAQSQPKPELPKPVAQKPAEPAPPPPKPVATGPDLDSAAYQAARAAREQQVRTQAQQEFARLLAMHEAATQAAQPEPAPAPAAPAAPVEEAASEDSAGQPAAASEPSGGEEENGL